MTFLARPFLAAIWRTPALRRSMMICIVLALVATAAEVGVALTLLPILASLGVDAGEKIGSFSEKIPQVVWLIIFALLMLVRTVTNWQSSIQQDRGTYELTVSLQTRLYHALAGAHWDAVRRVSPPALTNALQTQSYEAGFGFSSLVQVVSSGLLVSGYIASASLLFPWVLPLVFIMLLVMWRLNARRSSQLLKHADDYVLAQSSLHQRYEDWVAISRIAALGVDSGKLATRFESDARDTVEHALNISRTTALTRVTYDAVVAIVVLVGVPIAWQLETPPAFLAFGMLLAVRVLPRIGGIHRGYQGLINAVAPVRAVEQLTEALEREPAIHAGESEPLKWQNLELERVGVEDAMRASDRRWILQNIDLSLRHGEWLALTGATGAGKTTLADVMLTLIRPDTGELKIDGQPITDALASRWRSQAAYVPQDVVLFDASIRDNLKLYVPDATDSELKNALRQSAADFVYERLPEGLDTQAGPGGRWLSGGERQRIGIARALLKNPAFLVLDEPTAALDAETQAALMHALSKLQHTMSVVLITHRPELLELAGRVINIADGSIKS